MVSESTLSAVAAKNAIGDVKSDYMGHSPRIDQLELNMHNLEQKLRELAEKFKGVARAVSMGRGCGRTLMPSTNRCYVGYSARRMWTHSANYPLVTPMEYHPISLKPTK